MFPPEYDKDDIMILEILSRTPKRDRPTTAISEDYRRESETSNAFWHVFSRLKKLEEYEIVSGDPGGQRYRITKFGKMVLKDLKENPENNYVSLLVTANNLLGNGEIVLGLEYHRIVRDLLDGESPVPQIQEDNLLYGDSEE